MLRAQTQKLFDVPDYTGDNYYVDKDGFHYASGRADDMLKVGGVWVSPLEVENWLSEHPAVLQVAVVGRRDEQGLVKPVAYLVLREGFSASKGLTEELKKWALHRLALKYSTRIEFTSELPKSGTDRIPPFKLRSLLRLAL